MSVVFERISCMSSSICLAGLRFEQLHPRRQWRQFALRSFGVRPSCVKITNDVRGSASTPNFAKTAEQGCAEMNIFRRGAVVELLPAPGLGLQQVSQRAKQGMHSLCH